MLPVEHESRLERLERAARELEAAEKELAAELLAYERKLEDRKLRLVDGGAKDQPA